MFLKKSKYKNGRTFLSIVEAYRDENGKPKQRLIQKISYLPFKYIYNELNNYEIRKIYRVLSKIEDTFKVSKQILEQDQHMCGQKNISKDISSHALLH